MERLDGYDGRFVLRCWPKAPGADAPVDEIGGDLDDLKARAAPRIASGAFSRVDLLAWNFELNDWVRVDAYLAP